MAEKSRIGWTDATWNPITGCTPVSEACRNCYAARWALEKMANHPKYIGLSVLQSGRPVFTGEVRMHADVLGVPLRWRDPQMIFPCSMSDLFHERVPIEFIVQMLAVMALTPQHRYQVLTKRPERAAEVMGPARELAIAINRQVVAWLEEGAEGMLGRYWDTAHRLAGFPLGASPRRPAWSAPLGNVLVGVSAENQATWDQRVRVLPEIPAAGYFVSVEPMLGPVAAGLDLTGVDWVIIGCERVGRGPGRPCPLSWVRDLVGECRSAGVPVFVKQLEIQRSVQTELRWFPRDLQIQEFPECLRTAAEPVAVEPGLFGETR